MTRFALIGGGWRAEFFARIAQALPERFQLTGAYLRDPLKRGAWHARFGGRMAESIPELMEDKPDFLIVSIARRQNFSMLMELMDLHIPILVETTPAETLEDMTTLYRAAREKNALTWVIPASLSQVERIILAPRALQESKASTAPGNRSAMALKSFFTSSVLK